MRHGPLKRCRLTSRGGTHYRQLLLGSIPGVIVGSIVRVELVPGPRAFDAIIAIVLIPLGTHLVLRRTAASPSRSALLVPLVPIAAVVGCVGGIYGIGGGSILAPILIGAGWSPKDVAPATLASTLVTSVAGVAAFLVLATLHRGSVVPDWTVDWPSVLAGSSAGLVPRPRMNGPEWASRTARNARRGSARSGIRPVGGCRWRRQRTQWIRIHMPWTPGCPVRA